LDFIYNVTGYKGKPIFEAANRHFSETVDKPVDDVIFMDNRHDIISAALKALKAS